MYIREITVLNISGIHARPASDFIMRATKFKSTLTILLNNNTINAKSIIQVMSLGLSKGMTFKLVAEGEDEVEAVDSLAEYVANIKD